MKRITCSALWLGLAACSGAPPAGGINTARKPRDEEAVRAYLQNTPQM